MNTVNLSAQPREGTGKQAAKRVRRTGMVPAIIYGRGQDPRSVQVDSHELKTLIHKGQATSVINLEIEGDEDLMVLLRDPIRHPVSDIMMHADFLRVTETSRVHLRVPIELEGMPAGVVEGGIMDQIMRDVSIECEVRVIPEIIKLDVSELEIGQNISIGELEFEGIRFLADETATIVTISLPRAEEEEEIEGEEGEEGEELEEGAEPEVIGAKSEEEDSDAE
jgi:large subunit ribosomal protein L25